MRAIQGFYTEQRYGWPPDVNARLKNAQILEDWRRQANLPCSGGIGEVAPSGAYSELKANRNSTKIPT